MGYNVGSQHTGQHLKEAWVKIKFLNNIKKANVCTSMFQTKVANL